jgi:hypothetical protein
VDGENFVRNSTVVLLTKTYYSDQIMEVEKAGMCNLHRGNERSIHHFSQKPEGHLGHLSIDRGKKVK